MVEYGTGVKDGVETNEAENLMHGHNDAPLGFCNVEEMGISEVVDAIDCQTPEITKRTIIGLVGNMT
jgi:hypothetical protein